MSTLLARLEVRQESDVAAVRQQARAAAALLGLDGLVPARLAAAVAETARIARHHSGGAAVELLLDTDAPPSLLARVRASAVSEQDLESLRQLVDRFEIDISAGAGTVILLGKKLSRPLPADPGHLADELARLPRHGLEEEAREQDRALLHALAEVDRRQMELAQLAFELEDTNRGVVALYAELDEQAAHLRRISELKSRFLSSASHELRTPLHSILSLAHLLLDRVDGELTAEQEKQVTLIRQSAEGLLEQVNDLLDLARIEAGKMTVRAADLDVHSLFAVLRGVLRPLLAGRSSVALVFEEPTGLPLLHTDEGKVTQVLRNFIANALKFTERGEVRVRAVAGPEEALVFSVADTGVGVAAEDREAIFEEFTRIEGQGSRSHGTGLGLSLSRRLAELLGGRVWVESTPGGGSTFFFHLPCVYRGPTEVSLLPESAPP
jgi:signal transduction histidine kinase